MGRKAAVLAKTETTLTPEPAEALDVLDVEEPESLEVADDSLETEAIVTDNVGEVSVEINVENLIAELEAESHHGQPPDMQCARRKLEDYLERKRIAQDLEDFDDFAVDDGEPG